MATLEFGTNAGGDENTLNCPDGAGGSIEIKVGTAKFMKVSDGVYNIEGIPINDTKVPIITEVLVEDN